MNLLELKNLVDRLVQTTNRPDLTDVVIKTSDEGLCCDNVVDVDHISQGVDWYARKIVLFPKQNLYKNKNR